MSKTKQWGWRLLAAVSLVCVAGLAGGGARPVPAAAESRGVELAVYNQDLALVQDRRTIDLEAGLNEVRFADVAAQIDPTSVHFRSLDAPGSTTILEQNYEYDVVGSARLLQKYVDQQVRAVTRDGTTTTGTLLSGEGDLILQAEDGQVTVLRLDQIQEFTFPALPEGLITRPTLVWQVEATQAGSQAVEVTYLTGGIDWLANYVAVLAEDDTSLDLNGWVTLDNRSGATYRNAKLKLIAGDIHRAPTEGMMYAKGDYMAEAAAPAPEVQERGFFEYHLYEVRRPVTIRDRQTKQVEFVSATGIAAEKLFVYDGSQLAYYPVSEPLADPSYGTGSGAKVQVMLQFENKETSNLGIPLPKGTIRVFKQDVDGSTLLAGEDAIDHTPRDETVRLTVGDAFDVVGERIQTDFRVDYDDNWMEESYQVTLRNHKAEDVEVRVVEHMFRWSQWTLPKESLDHEKLDAQTIQFLVQVEAGREAQVTYTVRYEW